jgi:hypothetical protein
MDADQLDHYPERIDRTVLTPIVRRVLDRDNLTIASYQCQPLTEGSSSGAGVFRFSGTGDDSGETVRWSLILKHAVRAGETDDPSDLSYWKREYHVYGSGLLETLTPGLVAPRCYQSTATDSCFFLWLEDMATADDLPWSPADFGIAAAHFGRWNGSFLVDQSLPRYAWLVEGRIHQRVRRTVDSELFENLSAVREHPLARRSMPNDIVAPMLALWDQRELLLRALDRLPKTLQHGDAGRKNLFLRRLDTGPAETIAIDWGWTGNAAVGSELAALVASATLWFIDVQPEDLPELSRMAFAGYLRGLREAGWTGDVKLPRLGYVATLVLRFAPLLSWFESNATTDDGRTKLRSFYSQPLEDVADRIAAIRRFSLSHVEEIRSLAGS